MVTVKNGEDGKTIFETLTSECVALRSSTNKFNSMYDVLGCLRSYEKVAFILRHAQREKDKYEQEDGLNDEGRAQSKQVGEKLKELQLEDFYYMYTDVKRNAETASIIAFNKGDCNSYNLDNWHKKDIEGTSEVNTDIHESWFIKPNKNASSCKDKNAYSGWSTYSKVAYKEYKDDTDRANCESVFYDIDEKVRELIDKYFTYDKMHKYTLAISHDQFLVPFVISVSNRTIKDKDGYDLRFHKHDRDKGNAPDYNYWINYLAGVAIITDPSGVTTTIPVKALDDGFLREYN